MQWEKMDYQERTDLLTDLVEVCHMMAHWCRRHVLKELVFFFGQREDEPKEWRDCVSCEKARRVRLVVKDRAPLSYPLSLASPSIDRPTGLSFIEVQDLFKNLMERVSADPALRKNKAFVAEVRDFIERCVALQASANADTSVLPELLDDAEKRARFDRMERNIEDAKDAAEGAKEAAERTEKSVKNGRPKKSRRSYSAKMKGAVEDLVGKGEKVSAACAEVLREKYQRDPTEEETENFRQAIYNARRRKSKV